MTDPIKVVGIDPSLRNWGLAEGLYDLETGELRIKHVEVVRPDLPDGKQVRQNSLDLESAYQHFLRSMQLIRNARAIFVEVPIGSQSARAMASYGVSIGVLGSIRGSGKPFFEVSPTEVKLAGPGHKTATKSEMIEWAAARHPEAPWPFQKNRIVESKAEHMADAIAAIHAGIAGKSFQQFKSLIYS